MGQLRRALTCRGGRRETGKHSGCLRAVSVSWELRAGLAGRCGPHRDGGGGLVPTLAGQSSPVVSFPWPLDSPVCQAFGGQRPTEFNAPWGCSSLPAARDVVTKRNAAIVMGSLQCPSTGRDGVTGCLRLILGLPQMCVAVGENDTVTCTSCVRRRPPAP